MDGYERDTTPAMARLGSEGHAFTQCISHSLSTLPSTGTIMTGYPPAKNTVGVSGNVLPDGVRTIPERFGEAGYQTACLSRNSYLSDATELNRGFDRFQWLAASTLHQTSPAILLRYLWNIREHSAGLTTDTAKHATPFLMNEIAKDWLQEFSEQPDPFFCYLHYNEPHRPYYPPLSYVDKFTDDLSMSPMEAAEFALDVHYNTQEIIADGCDLTDEEWAALHAMYDAEIAYTDDMVGRLIEYVRSLPLEDTIIVVTADHGELFGEYGLLSHDWVLHDAVTHVPLVVSGLDDDLAVADDDLVQHGDIMSTLLAKAGGDITDLIGVDLREEGRDVAVSQRGPMTHKDLTDHNPEYDTSWIHDGTLTALRTEEFKYQRGAERDELFKLPDEETDIRESYPEIYDELSETCDEWIEEYAQPITQSQMDQFSGAVQKQLQDLGYME
jgi:uncharacterized sulfatase